MLVPQLLSYTRWSVWHGGETQEEEQTLFLAFKDQFTKYLFSTQQAPGSVLGITIYILLSTSLWDRASCFTPGEESYSKV